jgi:hypothetical protein
LAATQPRLTIVAAALAALGDVLTIEVRQIGDLAASRPAQLSLTVP